MSDAPIDLVLLPGLDGSDALFEPLRHALPSSVRTHVVTLPDSGPNDYASIARHIRDRLAGLRNPVILAWSFSGPVGIRLAADPTIAPRALILASSFARNPHPYLRAFGVLAQPWLLAPFTYASRAKALLGGNSSPSLQSLLRRAHRGLTGRLLSQRVRAVLGVDDLETLSRLRLPVLYLRASRDLVVPASSGRLVAKACPQARVVELQGPHLSLATAPAASAGAILEFLGGLGAS